MKAFLKHIGFLFVAIIAILYIVDYVYTSVYKRSVPRNKTQYIMSLSSKDTIDYVFFGSSRVENSIVASKIENTTKKRALNLGVLGTKLSHINLFLNLLAENKVSVKRIFVQVDYNYNLHGNSELIKSQIQPYIKDNEVINNYLKKEDSNYFKNYYIPFYRYASNDYKLGIRELIVSSIGRKTAIDLSDGFRPVYGNLKPMNKKILPKTIHEKNIDFEEIDSICKANKIDVTYYCAPFCPNLENDDYIEQLKLKINGFKDFSKSVSNNEMFSNCSHLNEKGAYYFTELLIKELNL